MPNGRWTCAVAALLLQIAVVSESVAVLRDPRIDRIGVQHGLPDGTIYSIALDAEGFLWFGTANGLVRYDGYGFTVYTHDPSDPDSISTNLASHAFADRQGRLWIGTWGGGLERYDPEIDGFRHLRASDDGSGPADSRVQTLFEDRNGAIWLGLFGSGLQRLDPVTLTFRTFAHDPEDETTLSDGRVWSVAEDSNGYLWVATSAGLDRLDPVSGTVQRNAACSSGSQCLPDPEVRTLLFDSSGDLWIGTRNGLVVLDSAGEGRIYRQGEKGLRSSIVNVLFEDRLGRVWVGTTYGGLSLWDEPNGRFRVFRYEGDNPNSLSNDDVRCLMEDQAGLLWIGTRGEGVNKLDPGTPFKRYRYNPDDPENGLLHPRVWSVVTDAMDRVWVGTSAGMDRIDRDGGGIIHLRHNPSRRDGLARGEVRVLHVDSAGTLWVATQTGSLQRLTRDSLTASGIAFESIPARLFGGVRVHTIIDGPDGSIWLGTEDGVHSFGLDGRPRVQLRSGDVPGFELLDDGVIALEFDDQNRLWIGTHLTGVYRYDRGSGVLDHFLNSPVDSNTLSRNEILSLLDGGDGTLWIGTRGGGLNRLDGRTGDVRRFSTSDGLPNNVIHSLIRDENERVWIGTNVGLSRFDPKTGAFRNFDVDDGVQGSSFLTNSVHRSARGEIYFGGVDGLTAFFAEDIRVRDRTFVPPVRITGVRLFGDAIETSGPVWAASEIELGPEDDYLSIEFAVLDFTNPRLNRYAYKLEGFDRDWIDAGPRHEVAYTNLDGGDYVFRVKGANHLGAWNEEGAALRIRVTPRLIERTWFRITLLVAALVIIWIVFRIRLHGARKAKARLEALVQERTSELETKTVELENAYRAAEELSYTDALTGLRNRHFLRDTIDHDIARVVREHESRFRGGKPGPPERADLLFVLADLDRFKLVNDTSGHRSGDRVLSQMGKLFLNRSRGSDLVVRWGGEEFLILYRSVDREKAPFLVEQLREGVASELFDLGDGSLQKMTCSFGFAAFPFDRRYPHVLDWERVLELADQALYESKRSGRNTWTGVESGPAWGSVDARAEVRGRIGELIERRQLRWIRRQA